MSMCDDMKRIQDFMSINKEKVKLKGEARGLIVLVVLGETSRQQEQFIAQCCGKHSDTHTFILIYPYYC